MKKNSGIDLWKRAQKLIPGGNMLLSKRSEQFLPGAWPSYFQKSSGCEVWDLDGNKYTDVSIMGIGTNILGYGHPEIDGAVKNVVNSGNMSTFNCPEEVYLAEKLVDMHPWADMVKFARSGGEANAIAIRISRAATGKDNIAVCGYHGWHDWYLAANLGNSEGLDGHLLPGLPTLGVPRGLQSTVHPFSYNNIDELEMLIKTKDIGTIKMEVSRSEGPRDNFLEKVRALATKNNVVLIFDECTSGFRETFGGLHKKYQVQPDLAIFGKAIGNGYALTAVIGKQEFMQHAQASFISSTFWTERIGPVAALKTLEVMESISSWDLISETGTKIRNEWKEIFDSHGVEIEISGLSALPAFNIISPNALAYKTLITQEMLKLGYLASNTVYVCTKHTQQVLDGYFERLNDIIKIIAECEDGRDINTLLDGLICHSGFKRLN
jgi:glutamate-1-semialdehyde 2,1-aminomutase